MTLLTRCGMGALLTLSMLACASQTEHNAAETPPQELVALSDECSALGQKLSDIPQLTLSETSPVAAKQDGQTGAENYPEHCVLRGALDTRTGTDGKTYAIGFELRLPRRWNRRFFFQGGGGTDGTVNPALGTLGSYPSSNALSRGFAVVSTDAGHVSEPMPPFIGDALFGLDPQARVDYGYRAVGRTTAVAKQLVERAYATRIEHSYFVGCSNGGRQAMVAAARFPEQFDGIIAGDPGFELPRAAIQHAWDYQQLLTVDASQPAEAFNVKEMAFVARRVLDKCDLLDGAADGMVTDLQGCKTAFDLARDVAVCTNGQRTGDCLTQVQIKALAAIMGGPVNSSGTALYSDWAWDHGMGAAGMSSWRGWKLGLPTMGGFSLIGTLGAAALAYVFTTPPVDLRPNVTPDPFGATHAFLAKYDFDQDAPKISATSGEYSESAVGFMQPPDATKLAAFAAKHGKLLVYHGTGDPVFSSNATIRWYSQLQANVPDAADFARLFLVPGMCHCNGGPATDAFDSVSALVDWVERGVAPDSIEASLTPTNTDVPADWSKTRTRPLCAFPSQAISTSGASDLESAKSFSCRRP